MKSPPVFKQGFFASQTRLLYTTNKASLQCKEALFENGGNNDAECVTNAAKRDKNRFLNLQNRF